MYDPDRHEPLVEHPWDEAAARAAIEAIAASAVDAWDPERLFPTHPLDVGSGAPPGGYQGLYLGAAGVWWALDHLARAGLCPEVEPPDLAQLAAKQRAAPDIGERVPSYWLGTTGTAAIAGAPELEADILANADNPTWEPLWGSPGTMEAARFAGLSDAWLHSARRLLERWVPDDDAGCRMWTQDLYGRVRQLTGAGHGLAGNLHALLAGAEWLEADERAGLYRDAAAALLALVTRDDGLANWLPATSGTDKWLLQWCHGAPGVVTSVRPLPVGASDEVERVLQEAGELVWRAGPLTKGPGLCHGTAGNGYTFLVLHARTGDELWLDRARAFAVHAMRQCEAARATHGAGRHNLWTGDLGLACYLHACMVGDERFPTLDVL